MGRQFPPGGADTVDIELMALAVKKKSKVNQLTATKQMALFNEPRRS